jgi:hypothetical protein
MLDRRASGDYGEASGQSRPSACRRVAALEALPRGRRGTIVVYWEAE